MVKFPPVSEITIAGNLLDIFKSLIPADDLEFNFGLNSPSLLVRNLTVGGIQLKKISNFHDLKKNCKFAILEAGKIAIKLQKKINLKYKSKNQPVTNADIEINNYLYNFFQSETPNFGWLSEESVDDKSRFKNDYYWCLDPIDGTRSYISGKPEYTISLALMKNAFPILGIIFNPVTKEFFLAEKNRAFCNQKKLNITTKKKLKIARLQ